ncbi:MAG TPA: hypothetical protein VK559_10005 [Ferruginibacter sp.]|nr:hypothetical protein [Ferruginibacter sp.]
MKKIFLFTTLALLIFASCKKSSSPITTNNTITASVDGVTYTCNTEPGNELYQDSTGTNDWYRFDAWISDSNNVNGFYIYFGKLNQPLTTGTYGAYGDSTTQAYIEYDSTGQYWGSQTILNPATIKVTSISGSTIQGTFSGTVYLYEDSTSANKKVITNGKFNLSTL